MRIKILYLLLMFSISVNVFSQTIYFSKDSLAYDSTLALYNDALIIKLSSLDSIVTNTNRDSISKKFIRESDIFYSICKPLIDQNGNLLAVILVNNTSPNADSLVIEKVLRTRFWFSKYVASKRTKFTFLLHNRVTFSSIKTVSGSEKIPNYIICPLDTGLCDATVNDTMFADSAGIRISNKNWNWEVYVNSLKKRLEKVWDAPPQYKRLGLIHGATILRFGINRNGSLACLNVLEQEDHYVLEQSSIEAILNTFPFDPLPGDFPGERLTLTVQMNYPNLKEK